MLANGRYDMELMWGPSILLAAGFIVQEICREKVKAKAQELSFTRNPVYPQYFYHTLEGKEETVGNNNAKDEEIVGTAVLVKKFKNSVRRVCDTCRKRKKACGLIDPTRANELCEAFQRTRGDEP
ncbi:uncharacterized protein LOC135141136 [Zophobas morio]|uniref:uncharacterized protein LOC135141136 n=1 Tax=Zophobas morio TaxID=2755281 RepID=UPI0030839B6C